jgi:hypothetical protein
MPSVPAAIRLVLAAFASLFSARRGQAQVLLLGASLTPRPRPVTAALRVMGLALERHFTTYPRVVTRATWSALRGSQSLWG